ncbi:MAG TPA: glycosyltransferase family 39 protein, partial [Candidatus Limnocylindrales bacterium]
MDPIAVALTVARATAALALLFVLPGLTLGPLILPGAPTPLHVIGRAIGLSLLIVSGTCTVLAGLGLLRAGPLLAALAVEILAPLASPTVRASLRRLAAGGRRRRAWWLGALAGLAVLAVTVVGPSRATVGDDLLPKTSTPWYYMAVAREVADSGTIPATIAEWGQARPFPTDYLPATAHAAAALELLPGDLLVAFTWYRLAILVAAALLVALLLRRWFSTWIAILGACLLLGTVRLAAKFLDDRPETFALALAVFAIWAADRAMTDRSRRTFGVALAAAVATFLSHAEVFLLLGPAIGGLAVAHAINGPGRLGIRIPGLAQLRPIIVAAAILGVAVLGGSGLNALFAGDFRLVGYVTATRQDPPPVPADRIPAGWTFSTDPTWNFYVASVAPALVGQPPPANFFGSSLLPRAILDVWPGLDARGRGDLVMLAGLLLGPILLWPWLDRRRRRFVLGWWLFGIG